MKAKHFDLVTVLALSLATTGISVAGVSQSPWATLFGLPAVLFAPGYVATEALLPQAGLTGAERLVLSLGASLAIAVLGGLLLNLTAIGLRGQSWSLFLSCVTAAGAAGAIYRRRDTPPGPRRARTRVPLLTALLAVVMVASVVVVMQLARQGDLGRPRPGFTQLWMLPVGHAHPQSMRIGVHNMERRAVSYRLEVTSGNTVLHVWDPIRLEPAATWQVSFDPNLAGPGLRIEGKLYRLDAPAAAYRRVAVAWPPGP